MGTMRLAWSDLRLHYRPWVAVFAVAVVAAMCVSLFVALIVVGSSSADSDVREGYSGIAVPILVMTVPTAVVAVAVAVALCIRLSTRTVALWQLAGVLPRQAGRVVYLQQALVCILGAVPGVALGALLWPAFGDLMVASELPDSSELRQAFPLSAAVWTVVAIVAVSAVAGLAAVWRTGRVEPVALLHAVEPDERRVGVGRAVVAVLAGAGAVAALVTTAQRVTPADYDGVMETTMVYLPFAMAVVVLVVALGPVLFGPLMRVWTAVVPARWSTSWYLARGSARYHLSSSSAVITPLYVGASVVGVTYVWVDLGRKSAEAAGMTFTGTGTPLAQMVSMFGGAVLVAAVATAGVVFATARDTARETALLTVAGSTRGTILLKAVFESLVYALTAGLLVVVTLVVPAAAYTWALGAGPLPGAALASLPGAPFVVVGLGWVLILAATLVPTTGSLRHSPVGVLRSA